jgi:ribonuclease VapC
MVIDTSAILAILGRDPKRRFFLEAIEAADSVRMSAVSAIETCIVIKARYGHQGTLDLVRFSEQAGIEVFPVDNGQREWVRLAFGRFGKGWHRAALNYGDCFSYALAMHLGERLLFKGDHFIHTDVRPWPASNAN